MEWTFKTKDGATITCINRYAEFTMDYIRRELWGDKMSKPRTKDEVLKFLEDNPKSAEKLLELVASIACDAMADEEVENDLPISPGDWYVGNIHKECVLSGEGAIVHCCGSSSEADAIAIAALPELLRATWDILAHAAIPLKDCHPTVRRLHHALKAAIGIAPHSEGGLT